MERLKKLTMYQKIIIAFMAVMIVVFICLYAAANKKVGFEYENVILLPAEENGLTVYSGKVNKKQVAFAVSEREKTVVFTCDGVILGRYTVLDDPDAVPELDILGDSMTGVEVVKDGEMLFRGGMQKFSSEIKLTASNGDLVSVGKEHSASRDVFGEPKDSVEPDPAVILELVSDPYLTNKGHWADWYYAVFICVLTAVSILFADDIFRWNLSFEIKNARKAEPSDWEIARRHIVWTVFPLLALALFIIGLRY